MLGVGLPHHNRGFAVATERQSFIENDEAGVYAAAYSRLPARQAL
jgi:hypothetical protein